MDRLRTIVDQKLKAIELGETDYNNVSWSHKQAHYNGMRQAYKDIGELIDTIQ